MSIFYRSKLFLKKLLPWEVILWARKLKAVLAVFYYRFPARKLRVIGVAGTKGKTTTTNLIARILEEAGFNVAMFSTANMRVVGRESLNTVKLTTPSPLFLQKFLAEAGEKKCDYAVIEVSSHALDQHRLWGVDFKAAVITNLMPDHLDYHKTADEYRDTHLKMIGPETGAVIINGEDEESQKLKVALRQDQGDNKKKSNVIVSSSNHNAEQDQNTIMRNNRMEFNILTFGLNKNNELVADNVELSENGVKFKADFQGKILGEFILKIPGKFNVYNALAAISAGLCLGIAEDKIKSALEKVSGVPGRLEKIYIGAKQDFQVIVDYAHSPDSLQNIYEAIKPYAKNRLIAVLGGTGDRDKGYRARCGALADRFADIVIVTNEDPYSEDPEDIIKQVLSGIKSKKIGETLFRILDRKEAIKKAVALAQKGDVIIITGKGSEQFMVWGEKMIPWDDREIAREALKIRFRRS